jgi:copper(I)-binding protein
MRKFLFLLLLLAPLSQAANLAIVKDAWVRLPPPGADIAAAYLTLEAKQPLTLSGAKSPAAEAVELHSMSMKNGVMEMRHLPALELAPGKPVTLEPGGLHLMLINLKKPLKAGDKVRLVLSFKQEKHRAQTISVQAIVKAAAN